MAEIVDSIVAELIARDNGYIATFDRAITKHKEFTASVPKIDGIEVLSKGAKQYADQHAQSLGKVVKDEEQASQRISATRKKRVAEAKASDEAEVASAKRTAKAKADAEIVEAQRSARARKAVERGLAARAAAIAPGSGHIPNSDLSRGGAPLFIPPSALGGSQAELAATEEIDRVTRDIAINKARLVGLEGQEREELQREIRYLETYNRLKKVGVAETEAQVLAEKELVAAEGRRGLFRRSANVSGLGQANQFALGASRGRFGYSFSPGALGGIAAAATVAVGVQAVNSAVTFARSLETESKELGVTTTQLQVYRKAAEDLDVTQQQLSSSFGQFNSNLGKAQSGASEQGKIFDALGISVKNTDGSLRNVGDVLPQVIDRLSSLKDESQRAAVETALFGETGRKLDGLLSGGTDAINGLADAMQKAGSVLSPQDIATLTQAGHVLKDVKNQLQVNVSEIVANNADAVETLARSFEHLIKFVQSAIGFIEQYNGLTIVAKSIGSPDGEIHPPKFIENFQEAANKFILDAGKTESQRLNEREAAIDANPLSHLNLFAKPDDGKVDKNALAKLFAPKGRTGRHGPTAEQKAADLEARQQRLTEERLEAIANLTQTAEDRAKAANARLDAERASYAKTLANDKKLTEAQRKELLAQEDIVIAEKREKVAFDKAAQIAEDELHLREQTRNAYLDELRTQESLAKTAAERRRLALGILATERAAEIDRAQTALRTNPPESPAYKAAQNELDPDNPQGISVRYGYARTAALSNTQGPLGQYLSALPRTKDQLDEAFQQAAVHGLRNLNDGLSTAVDRFLHLHGIAGEFLSDLIRIGLQREVMIPLADSLFPTQAKAAGGGGGGGLFGTIIKAAGSLLGGGSSVSSWLGGGSTSGLGFGGSFTTIAGMRANGGPVTAGGTYLVGERGPELLKMGGNGTVYPNAALSNQRVNGPSSQPRGPTEIVLHVAASDYFDARVHKISGAVAADTSVRVVRAAAPTIARQGAQASPAVIQRHQKLGS